MESTVTAIEMRRKFGGILDRVSKKGDHITIVRGERPVATLIPIREHETICSSQNRVRKIEEVLAAVDVFWKKHPALKRRVSRKSSVEIIRKMRDSRWSSLTHR